MHLLSSVSSSCIKSQLSNLCHNFPLPLLQLSCIKGPLLPIQDAAQKPKDISSIPALWKGCLEEPQYTTLSLFCSGSVISFVTPDLVGELWKDDKNIRVSGVRAGHGATVPDTRDEEVEEQCCGGIGQP